MDSERLNRAIALAKQGRKQEARAILSDLVMREPSNSQAWLWLADTMPTLPERVQILQEGLSNNPTNSSLQKAVAALGPQTPQFQSAPPPMPAAPSAFSTGDFQSMSGWNQPAEAEPEEDEEDWLKNLRSSTQASRAPVRPAPQEPPPAFTNPGGAAPQERDPADWLAALGGTARSEPAPAPTPAPPTPAQKAGTPLPTAPFERSEFLKPITTTKLKSTAAPGSAPEEPASPASPPAGPTSGLPKWLNPLKKEAPTPAAGPDEADEARPVELEAYEADEAAPSRRRWLGIGLVVILAAVVIIAGVMGWPIIQESVFTPLVAALTGPTPTQTLTPSITPTPTITPTLTPTPTLSPTPTATVTPIPALLKAEAVTSANIQQFKSLASVRARGKLSLETRLLAGIYDTDTVRIWSFATGTALAELVGPKAAVQQAAVSPDGKLAAAVSEEPLVWVWNIQSGAVVTTLEFSKDFISQYSDKTFPHALQVQFSPDNKTVLATSLLGVTWWDLQTKQEKHYFPLQPAELKTYRDEAAKASLKSAPTFLMAFSVDGKSLALGSPYRVYVLTWPGGVARVILNSKLPLFDMRWMDNGLLGLFHPGQVAVWDTNLNRQITTVMALKSQPADVPPPVAFRQDGKAMVAATENSRGLITSLKVMELPGGKLLQNFDPQTENTVDSPMFSPDGKLLFARSAGDLFIWDTTTGRMLRRIANRKGFSAVSADGKLYVELGTGDVSLWGSPAAP